MTIKKVLSLLAGTLLVGLLSACDSSKPQSTAEDATQADERMTAAASTTAGREFKAETVKVACGACVFGMEDAEGCPWAAEVDGKHYLMEGKLPTDDEHDTHGEHGMCNIAREAVVTGTLVDGRLSVTQMQITPMPAGS